MSRQRSGPDLFEDEPGDDGGVLTMLGDLISRHPSVAGGSVAFAVIFGFISSNALWHQTGRHPSPFLKTRDIVGPSAGVAASIRPLNQRAMDHRNRAREVTTYHIEHGGGPSTASIPVPTQRESMPNRQSPVVPKPTFVSIPGKALNPTSPKADPILAKIQSILAERGLYNGTIDGLMGPKSVAAIRTWERVNGYVETGEATQALLNAMAPGRADATITVQKHTSLMTQPQDLAQLIRIATPTPKPKFQPSPKPVAEPQVAVDNRHKEAVTEPAASENASQNIAHLVDNSELIRQIQMGLSNIAYADITVDGVAGAQTRAAISAFEKHYRLPVTGEPNEAVRKKLLEIGAL